MSSSTHSGNLVHDNTCNAALGVLQGSIAGVSAQASINASYVTFYKAVVASCIANNSRSGMDPALGALRSLGVNVGG